MRRLKGRCDRPQNLELDAGVVVTVTLPMQTHRYFATRLRSLTGHTYPRCKASIFACTLQNGGGQRGDDDENAGMCSFRNHLEGIWGLIRLQSVAFGTVGCGCVCVVVYKWIPDLQGLGQGWLRQMHVCRSVSLGG